MTKPKCSICGGKIEYSHSAMCFYCPTCTEKAEKEHQQSLKAANKE